MSINAAPRERSAYRRKPLDQMSNATLGDFFREPDSLVVHADIASAIPGYGSYKSIKNAVENGHLREPARLPNGRRVWRAAHVLHDLRLEKLSPSALTETLTMEGVECTADDENRGGQDDGPSQQTKDQTTESHHSRDRNGGMAGQ